MQSTLLLELRMQFCSSIIVVKDSSEVKRVSHKQAILIGDHHGGHSQYCSHSKAKLGEYVTLMQQLLREEQLIDTVLSENLVVFSVTEHAPRPCKNSITLTAEGTIVQQKNPSGTPLPIEVPKHLLEEAGSLNLLGETFLSYPDDLIINTAGTQVEIPFDNLFFPDYYDEILEHQKGNPWLSRGMEIDFWGENLQLCFEQYREFFTVLENKKLPLPERVIVSVHFLRERNSETFFCHDFSRAESGRGAGRDLDFLFSSYWRSVRKSIGLAQRIEEMFSISSTIGHLDLIKKYFPEEHSAWLAEDTNRKQVQAVLEELVASNISWEINTAGLGKPCKAPYPSFDLIDYAQQIAGNAPLFLTIGSDNHKPEDIFAYYGEAIGKLKEIGIRSLLSFQRRDGKICDRWVEL
ncbi:MAG: hypothetical protein WCP97_08640 [bacterium]